MRESTVQAQIKAALASVPRVYVMRRNVGVFVAVDCSPSRAVEILARAGVGARQIQIGRKGEADLQGFLGGQVCGTCGTPVHPMPFAVEVKTSTGRQSDEQKAWAVDVWGRRGGRYVVARSVRDAMGALGLAEELW